MYSKLVNDKKFKDIFCAVTPRKQKENEEGKKQNDLNGKPWINISQLTVC